MDYQQKNDHDRDLIQMNQFQKEQDQLIKTVI